MGSLTDLNEVLARDGFYETLRGIRPALVRSFLRGVIATEVLGPLAPRIAKWRGQAGSVPEAAREGWLLYLAYRMVPLIATFLYAGRPGREALFPVKGLDRLEEMQSRFGRAVLVATHVGEYLSIPGVLASHGLTVVCPVDARLVPTLEALNRRWLPWPERLRLVPVPGPVSPVVQEAVDEGAWLVWFPDHWYDPTTPLGVASRWPLQLAQVRGWPVVPVHTWSTAAGGTGVGVGDALWTPGDPVPAVERAGAMEAWMHGVIGKDPAQWWGWIEAKELPRL